VALEKGHQIGRYRIARLVAQGGMAEVYKADQELTAGIYRPVALKVIRPEYSESADFREMFLDEARTACTLTHPNIVQIYDVGEAEGLLYMAMELVPGETLATVNRTLREHNEKLSEEALFAIGISCCSALEAVHALKAEGGHVNLVHRDVSPHNLLLSSAGGLKLIDFGIAKAATNRNLTNPGVTKGKAGYFSPEQAMGKSLDGRSDLFSLGVTLYKLASGVTPFDKHKTHAERNGALVRGLWEPLEKVQPGLSPAFYEVVEKSMKLKVDERWPNARLMREALERAAYDSGYRIGTSSLIGYVENDGEITNVATGSRPAMKLADAPPGPTTPMRRNTEPLARRQSGPAPAEVKATGLKKYALPLSFGAAVMVGVVATLIIAKVTKDDPPPAQPPIVVKVTPKPPPQVEPVEPVKPPPDVVVTADDPQIQLEPLERPQPQPVNPTPQPNTNPVKVPPAQPKKPPQVAVAPVVQSPPAKVDEPVPAGQGKLRVVVKPESAVNRVMVDREEWGQAPIDRKIASGKYTVSVKLSDGQKSQPWSGPVMPGRTTTLIYDIESRTWSAR
jgi:eukaryotic-like serine/threonine-protein kinase